MAPVNPTFAEEKAFSFPPLNRAYPNVVEVLPPYEQGHFTLRMRSPTNEVEIYSHRLSLSPSPKGGLLAVFDVEFGGSGEVDADLFMGEAEAIRLTDTIVVPRQSLRVEARVLIEQGAEGPELLVLELPVAIPITLQSRLAGQLVTVCEGLSLFAGGIDCSGLERALTQIWVDLPHAGGRYPLTSSQLGDASLRRLLDWVIPKP